MNHFPAFATADNLGGNKSFMFCPVGDIVSIPDPISNIVMTAATMATGKTFLNGYAAPKTLLFEENDQKNSAGTYFIQKISGFYPKITSTILALFKEMQNDKFILIVKDNNGYIRLVGSLEQPAQFRYKSSTASNIPSRNGISFGFEAQSIYPALFYNPTIINTNPIFNPTE